MSVRLIFGLLFVLALAGTSVEALDESAAPSLSFKVTLNPVGSFEAKSKDVVGAASEVTSGYQADKIILRLASLKTGIELRDKHMTQKYLESAKYPLATLTQGVAKGGKFTAKLELHGKSREIAGSYEVKKTAGAAEYLEARFKTSLSAFDIEEASYMGVGVEDEVDVTARVLIKKRAP